MSCNTQHITTILDDHADDSGMQARDEHHHHISGRHGQLLQHVAHTMHAAYMMPTWMRRWSSHSTAAPASIGSAGDGLLYYAAVYLLFSTALAVDHGNLMWCCFA